MQPAKTPTQYVSSYVTGEALIEMVYDVYKQQTQLALCRQGAVSYHSKLAVDGTVLLPLSPRHDLVRKQVILFPLRATDYGAEADLLGELQAFIHRYVDVSPFFEQLAAYYVLLSWVYDAFNEVPYLRALGDYGSGKTRFLQVIGSVCYKPIFAGGATTTSPIFRMLDAHRGTLILDEADFQFSDATADIVKILNNGYARGFPVLRTEGKGTFEVKTFEVFSPKVIATRQRFKDRALESRFLVEEMGQRRLRADIPLSLPPHFEIEARLLRNKLLWWRFQHYGQHLVFWDGRESAIHPRLQQIILPLLSIIRSDAVRTELTEFIASYHRDLVADRGMSMEADALAALLMCTHMGGQEISIKQITEAHNAEVEERETISHKRMGWLLRHRLQLKTHKRRYGFVISLSENAERLALQREKYGLTDGGEGQSPDDAGSMVTIEEGAGREPEEESAGEQKPGDAWAV